MAIEPEWKHAYGILKDFIASNPEIQIGPSEVFVPEELRGRFYRHFDSIRAAVVESWKGTFDFNVQALSDNFTAAENALSKTLDLTIEMPMDLSHFLRRPQEGMMRLIYSRSFELVQGKIAEEDFQGIAGRELAAEATAMFRMGYETWVALALMVLLEPDGIWGIALDAGNEPIVAEIKEISFGRQFHSPAKRLPEFILHSKKLDSHIAFKMPLVKEVNAYAVPAEIPTQRLLRNRNGDTSSVLDHRMIFLSVVPDLKKIPVFADIHERIINGPDLAIELLMEQDLRDSAMIGQVQNRMRTMKPRHEAVAFMAQSSGSGSFKMQDNIDAYSTGLEPSGLLPILDKLVQQSCINFSSGGARAVNGN